MNYAELINSQNTGESISPLLDKLKFLLGDRKIKVMEFCGGHTHSFFNSGLNKLIESHVELIHGPGCPVCVLSPNRVGMLLDLLDCNPNVVVATYADMMRIQTLDGNSLKNYADRTHMVYSALDCLKLAKKYPDKEIVFAAIGFETTTPPSALLLDKIITESIENLSIFCNHVLTAPAIRAVMNSLDEEQKPDGIIGPGHVSMVTGSKFYQSVAEEIDRPISISGFEPYDLLLSLVDLANLINQEESVAQNSYQQVVTKEGNLAAKKLIDHYFDVRETFSWRGVGDLAESALKIKEEYSSFDAEVKFQMKDVHTKEHPACLCPKILMGKAKPIDCKLYGKACLPESPLGTCMVSSEGACSAYYHNGVGL